MGSGVEVAFLWLGETLSPAPVLEPIDTVAAVCVSLEQTVGMNGSPPPPTGPAFIKWGQWAATRHDLFPPDMCEELEKLHTQVCHWGRLGPAGVRQAASQPVSQAGRQVQSGSVRSVGFRVGRAGSVELQT